MAEPDKAQPLEVLGNLRELYMLVAAEAALYLETQEEQAALAAVVLVDGILMEPQELQILAEAAEVAAAVIQAAATQIMQSLLAEVRAALVL